MPQPGVSALKRLTDNGYVLTIKRVADDEYHVLIPPSKVFGSGQSPELACNVLLCSVLKRLQPIAS